MYTTRLLNVNTAVKLCGDLGLFFLYNIYSGQSLYKLIFKKLSQTFRLKMIKNNIDFVSFFSYCYSSNRCMLSAGIIKWCGVGVLIYHKNNTGTLLLIVCIQYICMESL